MWAPRGSPIVVPSAGQNRRVSVFGALDLSGELSCMIADRKRSVEFLEFLRWLDETVYPEVETLFLFMDNCSIHKTAAVLAYFQARRDKIKVIWNAAYAPNLNDIERIWGQLKRSSVNNYYFETVEKLEAAVLQAIRCRNRSARKQNAILHSLYEAA
jgi:transposase